ncbi:four helix bundle protein [bacterium]|nr:four helix bundle protein [bacterium]
MNEKRTKNSRAWERARALVNMTYQFIRRDGFKSDQILSDHFKSVAISLFLSVSDESNLSKLETENWIRKVSTILTIALDQKYITFHDQKDILLILDEITQLLQKDDYSKDNRFEKKEFNKHNSYENKNDYSKDNRFEKKEFNKHNSYENKNDYSKDNRFEKKEFNKQSSYGNKNDFHKDKKNSTSYDDRNKKYSDSFDKKGSKDGYKGFEKTDKLKKLVAKADDRFRKNKDDEFGDEFYDEDNWYETSPKKQSSSKEKVKPERARTFDRNPKAPTKKPLKMNHPNKRDKH